MKWFKQYLSLLVPLVALLVGIESIILVSRALSNHEEMVGKNYAIVIVSKTPLNTDEIKQNISGIDSLNALDSSSVVDNINAQLRDSSISEIKMNLPYFYSLRLESFPNQQQIKALESELLKMQDIIRVESFSKSHNQTYRLLVLLKGSVFVLSSLIFLLSLLLMIKQVEVWRFEHSERMEIMTYLGAPPKFKNAPLYRLALMDSVLSSLIVIIGVIVFANNAKIISITSMLGIDIFSLKSFILDYLVLLFSAYVISMFSVFMVILFQKEP